MAACGESGEKGSRREKLGGVTAYVSVVTRISAYIAYLFKPLS